MKQAGSISPSILVVRMDRLGDVIMSLPSVQRLRAHLPDTQIHFAIPKLYHELLSPLLREWKVEPCELTDQWLAQHKYKAALILFADRKTHFLIRKHRVKLRVGLFSKWWSFFLLNGGKRQRRSLAEKNEAEYNLDLADDFLERMTIGRKERRKPHILIPSTPASNAEAKEYLKKAGVKDFQKLAVVHPGMGGSALNLTGDQYLEIIATLEAQGFEVAVSIGPLMRDQELLKLFTSKRKDLTLLQNQPLPRLREIFRLAKVVVAPSTGPLHLAHYVGTKTVGLFSPVQSHSPKRWAPWGGTGESAVIAPEVTCAAKKECLGEKCADYFCFTHTKWRELVSR